MNVKSRSRGGDNPSRARNWTVPPSRVCSGLQNVLANTTLVTVRVGSLASDKHATLSCQEKKKKVRYQQNLAVLGTYVNVWIGVGLPQLFLSELTYMEWLHSFLKYILHSAHIH